MSISVACGDESYRRARDTFNFLNKLDGRRVELVEPEGHCILSRQIIRESEGNVSRSIEKGGLFEKFPIELTNASQSSGGGPALMLDQVIKRNTGSLAYRIPGYLL